MVEDGDLRARGPRNKTQRTNSQLTRQIAPTPQPQAPTRVFRQRVQHVVEEADARPDPDLLRG